MFRPRRLREAASFAHGVSKFLRCKRDVLPEKQRDRLQSLLREFRGMIRSRASGDALGKKRREIDELCARAAPGFSWSGIQENVEVIVVALVIALALRAYFVQPFKIPTNSMFPSLNGIVGTPAGGGGDGRPLLPVRLWRRLAGGEKEVLARAKRSGWVIRIREETKFRFLTSTLLDYRGGDSLKIPAARDALLWDMGMAGRLGITRKDFLEDGATLRRPARVEDGRILARGRVKAGDHVLVNKMAYHFRRPKRGEVFVFVTKSIPLLQPKDSRAGIQHYIKRLGGVPGDHLEIRSPDLLINGEKAREFGFVRVMSRKAPYHGYKNSNRFLALNSIRLGAGEYFALGDNSGHSFDSRMWGTVATDNLVGPALLVYWPFLPHFGPIR